MATVMMHSVNNPI